MNEETDKKAPLTTVEQIESLIKNGVPVQAQMMSLVGALTCAERIKQFSEAEVKAIQSAMDTLHEYATRNQQKEEAK